MVDEELLGRRQVTYDDLIAPFTSPLADSTRNDSKESFDPDDRPLLPSNQQHHGAETNAREDSAIVKVVAALFRWDKSIKLTAQAKKLLAKSIVAGTVLVLLIIILIATTKKPKTIWPHSLRNQSMASKNKPLRHSSPMVRFKDNLSMDRSYVTTMPYGGLTNQLLGVFKLVYLAGILERTAISAELDDTHNEGGNEPLSTYFDLETFSRLSNVSLVEWPQVKIKSNSKMKGVKETLSCWGFPETILNTRPLAGYEITTKFWPPPTQLTVPGPIQSTLTYPSLELLVTTPQTEWLHSISKSTFPLSPAHPDPRLLCFENLFYVPPPMSSTSSASHSSYPIEELSPSDPIWSEIGTHLHFNSKTDKMADEFMAQLFANVGGSESKGWFGSLTSNKYDFIAVHIRRGDFVKMGRAQFNISSYAAAVSSLQSRLVSLRDSQSHLGSYRIKKGDQLPVLFSSDSDDRTFVDSIQKDFGWTYLDHWDYATSERYGGWAPGILDSLVLSRASGFVGTKQSTFSYLAARRVESWNGGVSTIVGDIKREDGKVGPQQKSEGKLRLADGGKT